MKTRLAALLLGLAFACGLPAEETAAPAMPPDGGQLTAAQLEQLVGPIALYPDALIALILPAATTPADIVLAARYLKDAGDPAAVASRSWDESVKSLVHYAEVVKWMDENLAWTKQLGEAFAQQPAEVMQAIQRLRAKARAAGTLQDSPQQQVLADGDMLMIVPTQPSVLYVPYYDPLVVYAPPPDYYGAMTYVSFSSPFAAGPWLAFDCDWRQRTIWTAERYRNSRDHHDWRHPIFPGQPGYVADPDRHPWRPPSNVTRPPLVNAPRRDDITRPAPINTAPRPTITRDDRPDRSNDPHGQPQRNDGRALDPARTGGVAIAPAPATTATPATTPPPARRVDSGRDHSDSGDRQNRPVSVQNPPSAPPATRVIPVQNAPIGPMVPAPASNSLPQIRMPVAAPAAPTATPPPAAPPLPATDDRKRSVPVDSDQKKPQAN